MSQALGIAVIIFNAVITLIPGRLTTKTGNEFDVMQGSYYCLTALTNSVATLMIGRQIYSSTRDNNRARQRYRHIVEIALQSSAMYSVTMLATAIINIVGGLSVNFATAEGHNLFIVSNYLSSINIFTTVRDQVFVKKI